MQNFVNKTLVIVLNHIFKMGEQHALPAKTSNNKMYCNYGLFIKDKEGYKQEQKYYLFKEGKRFLLTSSKRHFDILIAEDVEEYSTKHLKIIGDFISKSLG